MYTTHTALRYTTYSNNNINSNIIGCLGLSQVVGTTLIGIPASLARPHGTWLSEVNQDCQCTSF